MPEGDVDDLKGFDQAEEGEGDFVDFDMLEQLVGEAEVAALELAAGGGLLVGHGELWWE